MLDGTDRATQQIRWCRNVKNIKRKAGSSERTDSCGDACN